MNIQTLSHVDAIRKLDLTAATFVDVAHMQLELRGDDPAFVFLQDGELPLDSLSFGDVHRQSHAVARNLREELDEGDRVILIFSAGYEFIVCFFACLYAGLVAVPAPAPSRRKSDFDKLESIVEDSGARTILTSASIAQRQLPSALEFDVRGIFKNIRVKDYQSIMTDRRILDGAGEAIGWRCPKSSATAFLQYTSGSTGHPKGVRVTHRNLIENQLLLHKGFVTETPSIYLSWLPLFHDMGLIGNLLHAFFIGQPYYFMTPTAFLQKPERWLRAISKFRARISGAPNFAYDLCVDRIRGDLSDIDLSCWQVAFSGAEPVRARTIHRFTEKFAPYGFDPGAFYPCYGTAESTLIISGGIPGIVPSMLSVSRAAYERSQIEILANSQDECIELVSSGAALYQDSVRVVDHESVESLADGKIGEIWICGPCVTGGYWRNKSETQKSFHAMTSSGEGPFLRTGDLGFIHRGEVYITGRLKDLIILNGKNYYPQDIEEFIEGIDMAIRKGRCAAFSMDIDERESLVLVNEIERTQLKKINKDALAHTILERIYEELSVVLAGVVFLLPASMTMTSSGKIQRGLCRQKLLNGELNVLSEHWFRGAKKPSP